MSVLGSLATLRSHNAHARHTRACLSSSRMVIVIHCEDGQQEKRDGKPALPTVSNLHYSFSAWYNKTTHVLLLRRSQL